MVLPLLILAPERDARHVAEQRHVRVVGDPILIDGVAREGGGGAPGPRTVPRGPVAGSRVPGNPVPGMSFPGMSSPGMSVPRSGVLAGSGITNTGPTTVRAR